jgi:hypothetical protein
MFIQVVWQKTSIQECRRDYIENAVELREHGSPFERLFTVIRRMCDHVSVCMESRVSGCWIPSGTRLHVSHGRRASRHDHPNCTKRKGRAVFVKTFRLLCLEFHRGSDFKGLSSPPPSPVPISPEQPPPISPWSPDCCVDPSSLWRLSSMWPFGLSTRPNVFSVPWPGL